MLVFSVVSRVSGKSRQPRKTSVVVNVFESTMFLSLTPSMFVCLPITLFSEVKRIGTYRVMSVVSKDIRRLMLLFLSVV